MRGSPSNRATGPWWSRAFGYTPASIPSILPVCCRSSRVVAVRPSHHVALGLVGGGDHPERLGQRSRPSSAPQQPDGERNRWIGRSTMRHCQWATRPRPGAQRAYFIARAFALDRAARSSRLSKHTRRTAMLIPHLRRRTDGMGRGVHTRANGRHRDAPLRLPRAMGEAGLPEHRLDTIEAPGACYTLATV